MNIVPGQTRFGRYQIQALVGAGGMGEVYRAMDTSLGRTVAIKVLAETFSATPEQLQRFQQEAEAAGALNHPNILAIYDIGTHEDAPFIVSELLEGVNLRQRLSEGRIPIHKALDYAAQVARGLSVAHERGIIHRDLKPENLFLTKNGHVKILDFGLAKLGPLFEDKTDEDGEAQTRQMRTPPGTIVGTISYMSPEQVKDRAADHRSDIFSFGVILYEMFSGDRPFSGDSAVETMNAIIKQEPQPLSQKDHPIPPALDRIVSHCLEKLPEDRFQSTRDLVFDLEAVTAFSQTGSLASIPQPAIVSKAQWRKPLIALGLVAMLLLVGGFFVFRNGSRADLPLYRQLSYRRGTIWSARFAANGQVVYSGSWSSNKPDILSTRPGSTESRSLGLENADVLAVSPSSELAVLINRKHIGHLIGLGTLARVPLEGGAPKEILNDVLQADWSPDGKNLAVVHYVDGRCRLEYPIGKVLYETTGYVSYPRISPRGDLIAFMDHPGQWDNRGFVSIVDTSGKKTVLTGEFATEDGLAWAPNEEIWFTASKTGEAASLRAVRVSGSERIITRVPTNLMIHDISTDGNVLLTAFKYSTMVIGLPPGEETERDLSWLDEIGVFDLADDGSVFLFQYYGEGSGTNYTSYLRKTDASPAKRLGEGAGVALSPDGKWVVAVMNVPPQTVLLPTGVGDVRHLERPGFERHGDDRWMPDSQHVIFSGKEVGKASRSYIQDINGEPKPVTPEGITGTMVSPDGKLLLAYDADGKRFLYGLDSGERREIHGLEDIDRVVRWGLDKNSLYVYQQKDAIPVKVYRLDLSNGHKTLINEIRPLERAGVFRAPVVFVAADGKSYIYMSSRNLGELYLVEGLMR